MLTYGANSTYGIVCSSMFELLCPPIRSVETMDSAQKVSNYD